MRFTPVLTALVAAALLSLAMAGTWASSASAAKPEGPTVRGELSRLLAAGAISRAEHDRDRAEYAAARRVVGRLRGRRRVELAAVLANVDAVAADHALLSHRLPLAFLTLRRNRLWWAGNGGLIGYGQRVSFPGSELVWQSYPGQGIQVQWLATFGKANALFNGGRRYDTRLRRLLAETTSYASRRAGGIAWESWFRFDGGRPPWVSALAGGTAIQAYSRAAVRLRDPALFVTARSALGIFRTAPPTGIRLRTDAGAHYLIYSFRPRLRVLNGFLQSLNGLADFAKFANDPLGRRLFAAGDRQARVELPRYDTGAWSMYSQDRESDLGYHKLVRDFLNGLCGRERALAGKSTPELPTAPDPDPYCQTAERFTRYLGEPPAVRLRSARPGRLRIRHPIVIPYTLSKISAVSTTVTRRGVAVAGSSRRVGRGSHELRFTPRKTGTHVIRVRAVDLAGNTTVVTGTVRVARR